jgi:hypothetical protein
MAKTGLTAKRHTFDYDGSGKKARNFIMMLSTYGKVRTMTKAFIFDVNTLKGEQRVHVEKRVRKLRKAIQDGTFTPTTFYANVTDDHVITNGDKNEITIDASEEKPLALIDAYQRMGALESLRKESEKVSKLVDNLPVPLIIYTDPDKRQENFLNINNVLPVSAPQMMSLKVLSGNIDPKLLPLFEVGRDVAIALNNDVNSPLSRSIKFDSASKSPISLRFLLSDDNLAFSLVGTAKILEKWGKGVDDYVSLLTEIYQAVKDELPELLTSEKLLSPPPTGPNGSAAMWIMVANIAAYRLHLLGRDSLTDNDQTIILEAISDVFDRNTEDGYATKRKKDLSGEFASAIFRDITEDDASEIGTHDGLPIALILLLGNSTFNCEKLPVERKKRGRKKAAVAVAEEVNDVD